MGYIMAVVWSIWTSKIGSIFNRIFQTYIDADFFKETYAFVFSQSIKMTKDLESWI
jgi:hypothetical protein